MDLVSCWTLILLMNILFVLYFTVLVIHCEACTYRRRPLKKENEKVIRDVNLKGMLGL